MMKKMRLFRRITATAMVFAMVGITSAFAASSESYGSMTNGKGEICRFPDKQYQDGKLGQQLHL